MARLLIEQKVVYDKIELGNEYEKKIKFQIREIGHF